jgi:hypothetical protein
MFVYKTFPMFMSHLITTYKCVLILSFACIFVNFFLLNEKIENILTIVMGDIKAHEYFFMFIIFHNIYSMLLHLN